MLNDYGKKYGLPTSTHEATSMNCNSLFHFFNNFIRKLSVKLCSAIKIKG